MVREAFRPGDVAMSYHNDPAYRVQDAAGADRRNYLRLQEVVNSQREIIATFATLAPDGVVDMVVEAAGVDRDALRKGLLIPMGNSGAKSQPGSELSPDGGVAGYTSIGPGCASDQPEGISANVNEINALTLSSDAEEISAKRHHPDGIAPPDEAREQRRADERELMEQYRNPADYAAACRVLHGKPDITPHVEAGETFARLIRGS